MSVINILKEKKYKWHFVNVGGTARVRINSGEDIAHLNELDPKMWTVLSCPTTGLEIDDKSLKYMDCDGDGKLRVNDVISVSQWQISVLWSYYTHWHSSLWLVLHSIGQAVFTVVSFLSAMGH